MTLTHALVFTYAVIGAFTQLLVWLHGPAVQVKVRNCSGEFGAFLRVHMRMYPVHWFSRVVDSCLWPVNVAILVYVLTHQLPPLPPPSGGIFDEPTVREPLYKPRPPSNPRRGADEHDDFY